MYAQPGYSQGFDPYGVNKPKGPAPTVTPGSGQFTGAYSSYGHPGAPVKGVTPYFLTTGAPQRVEQYAQDALPLIREATMGALGQNLATQGGIFRDSQRQLGDQLAMLGVNPAAAIGRFTPQANMQFAGQLGGLAAGARGQMAQGQMDLSAQVLNALNQIEAYYDSVGMQKWAADKAAKASSKAAGIGGFASLAGGLLGAGGAA
jgi:hypothetical protein